MQDLANQVVFVDDDDDLRNANVQSLQLAGLQVQGLSSAESAVRAIPADYPGVVVSDIRMPGMDGRQLFRRLHEQDVDLPVILITGHADVSDAVEAMHEGVYDFVAKPYAAERLISSIRRGLEKRRLVLENRRLRSQALEAERDWPLMGQTPVMERLRATLRQLAQTQLDVLIEGETGVGKELAARSLHAWGPRRHRDFVTLDCAALPVSMIESELFGHEAGAFNGALRPRIGRLQHADRGTLFLDGVESLPMEAQGKFLRVLEEREVTPLGGNAGRILDVRFVAATQLNLADCVDAGLFRQDLFHRLDVVRIRIPPLRERRDDIFLLFAHYAARAAERFGRPVPAISDAVRWRLLHHDWPGNVRELSQFAQRVTLNLDADVVATDVESRETLPQRVASYEARLIVETLAGCRGDVRSAVESLGIPRKTFYDKIARHGIEIDAFRHLEQTR